MLLIPIHADLATTVAPPQKRQHTLSTRLTPTVVQQKPQKTDEDEQEDSEFDLVVVRKRKPPTNGK